MPSKHPGTLVYFQEDAPYLYYYSSPVHKNLSSKFDENLAERSQFYTNHRINFSTPTYCQSATFGPLAFCVCPLFFMTKNQKEFRIATVAIFRCDLYAAVFPQMSPPPPTKNCARLRTTKHNGRFYSFINKTSFHGSRRFIFKSMPLYWPDNFLEKQSLHPI